MNSQDNCTSQYTSSTGLQDQDQYVDNDYSYKNQDKCPKLTLSLQKL